MRRRHFAFCFSRSQAGAPENERVCPGLAVILKVSAIKEGAPIELAAEYDPRRLELDFVDWHYLSKVFLTGCAERILNTVTFRGSLTGRVEQVCARCLEPIPRDISMPFNLAYEIREEEVVDTTGDLRDILLLDHPERFLCRDDCKGICARCGVNLNRESCHC